MIELSNKNIAMISGGLCVRTTNDDVKLMRGPAFRVLIDFVAIDAEYRDCCYDPKSVYFIDVNSEVILCPQTEWANSGFGDTSSDFLWKI